MLTLFDPTWPGLLQTWDTGIETWIQLSLRLHPISPLPPYLYDALIAKVWSQTFNTKVCFYVQLTYYLPFDPVVTGTSLLERVTGGNGRERCRTLLSKLWCLHGTPFIFHQIKKQAKKIATQPLIAFRRPSVCPETFESIAEPRPVHNAKGQAWRAGYFSDNGMLFEEERKCHNDTDCEQDTKYVELE